MSHKRDNFDYIWIFMGSGARTPTAVFTTYEEADIWIRENGLYGYLSEYPVGISVYDWAIACGYHKPGKPHHFSRPHIQQFGSAYLEHHHYAHPHHQYLDHVLHHVPGKIKQSVLHAYPHVRLQPEDGFVPLAQCNLVMLVGMTGSGKSTTLQHLRNDATLNFIEAIPSRRQLADLILIPTAQHLKNETIAPVKERVTRFEYTRHFRDSFAPGGTAEAFTWLYCDLPQTLILSEGVRGQNEIDYVLEHTRWRIAELWVDPVTRLQRLSSRNEAFDAVTDASAEDLTFLPDDRIDEVRHALANGTITPEAITTVRAETISYGNQPYDAHNQTENYHCFTIDNLTPPAVAQQVTTWIKTGEVQ
ncbi:MAG: hypothetical protein AAF653_08285 [Chloroflexota bacterium]